jgi:hypothetical protein
MLFFMAIKKFERQDTDYMREYIQEGVKLKETEDQIKARRRELADLFGCSLAQVAGAVAWKKNGDGLELKPLELNDSINTVNDVEIIEESAKADPATSIKVTPAVNPTQPLEIPVEEPVNITETSSNITVHPKSGAWADFERSAIKEKWRQVECEFIDKHLDADPEKRAKMRVLCTPGIKCYLEVRHLLSRGFKPENIIAIERDEGAWGDFESNCREIGITPMFGDLKEILPQITEPIDVACIDFLGPYCVSYLQILHQLPLADRAIVAVNMMAKREKKDIQENLLKLLRHRNGEHSKVLRDNLMKAHRASLNNLQITSLDPHAIVSDIYNEAAEQTSEWDNNTDDVEMSDELRDLALWHEMSQMGIERTINWLYPHLIEQIKIPREGLNGSVKKMTDEFLRIQAISGALGFIRSLMFSIDGQLGLDPDFRKAPNLQEIPNMTVGSASGMRRVAHMQKYKYLSRIGETPSPFYTNLAVVEKPKEYRLIRNAASFGIESAVKICEDSGKKTDPGYVVYIDKPLFARPKQTDHLTFKAANKKVKSISLGEMFYAIDTFQSLDDKYPLSDYMKQREIPRQDIK